MIWAGKHSLHLKMILTHLPDCYDFIELIGENDFISAIYGQMYHALISLSNQVHVR